MILFHSPSPMLRGVILASIGDEVHLAPDWDTFTALAPHASCAVVALDGVLAGPQFDRLTAFTRGELSTPIVLVVSDMFCDEDALGRARVDFIIRGSRVARRLRQSVASMPGNGDRPTLPTSSRPVASDDLTNAREHLAGAIGSRKHLDRHERELLCALLRADPPPASVGQWAKAAFCSKSRIEYHMRKRLVSRGMSASVAINVDLLLAALDNCPERRSWIDLASAVGVDYRRIRNTWFRLSEEGASPVPPGANAVARCLLRILDRQS